MAVISNMEKLVQAPPPRRRPWGLLVDVADRITDEELTQGRANRVGAGVTWTPWGCDALRRGNVDCDTDWLAGTDAPEYTDGEIDLETVDDTKDGAVRSYADTAVQAPFKLVDGLACSALSMDSVELTNRIQTRMSVFTSSILARELMDGWASNGISLSSEATTLTQPYGGIDGVFAALEEHLADTLHGARGLVHIPPPVLHVAKEHGYVAYMDGALYTSTGHLVVSDAGTDGTIGPSSAGATEYWLYASGPVGYYLSDPFVLGGSDFEVAKNTLERFVEAMGLVVFDPCSVGAVLLEMPAVE